MTGVAGEVVAVPKEAVAFATTKWGAMLFIVALLTIVIAVAESHRKGIVLGTVTNVLHRIPVIGPRLVNPYVA